MRFRGGGIGHKATYDWNRFLREDLGKAVDDDDEDPASNDLEIEMGEPEDEFEEDERGAEKHEELEERTGEEKNGAIADEEGEWGEWERVMEDTEDEDDDSNGDGDSDSDESDSAQDRVVADDGEELDDDIYAEEGYGAL